MKSNCLKAEMWDKVQYLFRNYYDGTMHSVFYYEDTLDIEALKQVYLSLLDKIPIFRSTFKANPIKAYWKVNENITADEFFTFIESDNLEAEIDKFIVQQINYKSRVQFKVCVIRSGGRDTLCVIVNHMCADGGDLKAFNIKVAESYSLLKGQNITNFKVKSGTRSYDQVYSTMSEEDKTAASKLMSNVSAVKNKVVFPFSKADNDTCRIIRYKISVGEFNAVKAKGKTLGATLNDILLAAFVRVIYDMCGIGGGDLTVPCMCDLRRHIKGGETYGFTNLTGFMPCEIIGGAGADIFETVEKIKKALEYSKTDKYIGLYSLPLLRLAYRVFPLGIANTAIKIGYQNPLIGMSNIGIIDANAYTMNGVKLKDAWYTGAIKYKPYFQLALTTFKGEITFSAAFRGNKNDDAVTAVFFEKLHNELKSFIK